MMIDENLSIAALVGCGLGLMIVLLILSIQTRVEDDITQGRQFIEKKRALQEAQRAVEEDPDLQQQVTSLKQQLAAIKMSRKDLFEYLIKLERTVHTMQIALDKQQQQQQTK